uniref:Eukaryotic translation initiation factor 5 n=1 Tax=Steinernema glaseri TaxID=37863 RepID=A0A1I7ZPT3_9BILA
MAINVNRHVLDPFYRYKMPRLQAKIEGKGNGIKTVIANMVEIGKSLDRPPAYLTKYFGCELGAQTKIDTENGRHIVNGDHDANKLQDILDGFIRNFILCPACDNPETRLNVKNRMIHSTCKACGHKFTIDAQHKLSAFIVKNPPQVEQKEKDVSKNDDNWTENGGLLESGSSADGEKDWEPEPFDNEENVSSRIGKLILSKDLDRPIEERLDMLYRYFLKAKKDGGLGKTLELVNEAERLELKTKAPLLLANALFDENLMKQLNQHRILLLHFTSSDVKAQKYLLGGIEQIITKHKVHLLPKTAHILKVLYDLDIVTERTILQWAANPSSKYVKKECAKQIIEKATVIINWLKEADEESEEDDYGFDKCSRTYGTVVPKTRVDSEEGVAKPIVKTMDDEINIDDI